MRMSNCLVVDKSGYGREFFVERIEVDAPVIECVQHAIADADREQRILQCTHHRAVESKQELLVEMAALV